MPNPAQLTNERLRQWLDGNQPARERLAIQLLPLLGEYSSAEPRRPMGGPDGGRDIQAVWRDRLPIWAAVGFRNSASDSPADKRAVKKKFKDDLDSAIKNNPSLKGFVFVTNVDLTPAEVRNLESYAATQGIEHVAIFYRERLRLALDMPSGFGIRLQALDIELQREEQVAFFDRLEAVREQQYREILKKQQEVDAKLARIEFLHDCGKPVSGVRFYVVLKQPMTPEQLGHFRIAVVLRSVHDFSKVMGIAALDAYATWHDDGVETKMFGEHTLVWVAPPSETLQDSATHGSTLNTRFISGWGYVRDRGPFRTLGDFDHTSFDMFVTEPLIPHIAEIGLHVQDYLLLGIPGDALATASQVGLNDLPNAIEFPHQLSPDQEAVPWRELFLRTPDTENAELFPPRRHAPRRIDFATYTPLHTRTPAVQGDALTPSIVFSFQASE